MNLVIYFIINLKSILRDREVEQRSLTFIILYISFPFSVTKHKNCENCLKKECNNDGL